MSSSAFPPTAEAALPPLRLALLTDGLSPYVLGGIQQHSRMLAESLTKAGVELTVFHTAKDVTAAQKAKVLDGLDRSIWGNIRVEFVDYPQPGKFPGHYVRDCWAYSKALFERYRSTNLKADYIYAQGLTGLAFVNRKNALPPVIVNLHGYEMFQRAASFWNLMEHWSLRPPVRYVINHADLVMAFPGRIKALLTQRLRLPANRIIELPLGIADEWLATNTTRTNEKRQFLFVGRNERRKGIQELSTAIRSLPPSVGCFHFVGPIPVEARINAPNVTYHGLITEPRALIARFNEADVLICPSYAEGMPTVILEAMSRGLAVIATDVGAVGTIVDEQNGILLNSSSPPDIAAAITTLADMSSQRLAALQASSRRRAGKYCWSGVAEQMRDMLVARVAGKRHYGPSS
jgi:glycosyltransferase involved in cell wall biosynthesis